MCAFHTCADVEDIQRLVELRITEFAVKRQPEDMVHYVKPILLLLIVRQDVLAGSVSMITAAILVLILES